MGARRVVQVHARNRDEAFTQLSEHVWIVLLSFDFEGEISVNKTGCRACFR